jgi:hypothetical protein
MTSTETVESAKQFLLNRLIQQASLDEIVLSDLEKRMFFFSELSANPDWEANEKFEAEYDDSEYEKKVAKLLRHAYSHDVKNPLVKNAWQECLKALSKEDFYGLVMVDQAKIPRPKNLSTFLSTFDTGSTYLMLLQLGILALAFGVVLNRIGSSVLVSDGSRLGAFAFLVAAAWGVGEFYRRWEGKRAAERLANFDKTDADPRQ